MLRVTFVVAPAFEMLDLSGPMCAFNSALAYHGGPYELGIVSSTGGLVLSCHGISIETAKARSARRSRQFARIFLNETGETPARAVERLRAEVARAQLADTQEPIELIAVQSGFGDAERMRRSFVRLFGQSPQALRRRARS